MRKRCSPLEKQLAFQLKALKISFIQEYQFHDIRRWRFDFVLLPLSLKIAIECEGGVFPYTDPRTGKRRIGRHLTGKGFTEDCEKYNEALELGWRVLRYTCAQIKSGKALNQIERILKGESQ